MSTVDLTVGIRLADPRPQYCSNCHGTTAERFVDFPAAQDAGSFAGSDGEWLAGSDDLALCESCVREACEVLGFKPELNGRQRTEINRLRVENDHWRDYAKTLEATLQARPEPAPRAIPRKVLPDGS